MSIFFTITWKRCYDTTKIVVAVVVELDPSLGGKPRRILKREGVENNELTFDSFRQSLLLWIE